MLRAAQANWRLAMVIPEELLAVGYAEELRAFLLRHFRRVVVCFPDANIFPEVQQAVVLLLCDNTAERKPACSPSGIPILRKETMTGRKPLHLGIGIYKWSHLFLSARERRCVNHWWSEIGWQPFSEYGRVEVGIVTGDNDFFILRSRDAGRFPEHNLVPIITSARALKGIRFDTDDFRQVVAEDRPAYLLNLQQPRSHVSSRCARLSWKSESGKRCRSGSNVAFASLGMPCRAFGSRTRFFFDRLAICQGSFILPKSALQPTPFIV